MAADRGVGAHERQQFDARERPGGSSRRPGRRAALAGTAATIPRSSVDTSAIVGRFRRRMERRRRAAGSVTAHEGNPGSDPERRQRSRHRRISPFRSRTGRPSCCATSRRCSRACPLRRRTRASRCTCRTCRCPSLLPTRRTSPSWRRPSTSTRCGRRSSSRCRRSVSSTASARSRRGAPATRCRTTSSVPTRSGVVLRRRPARCATGSRATGSSIHCNYVDDQDPQRARRLDAGDQPAHLGLRVELRRPRRAHRRQGEPAHAEADPPLVGGGGVQRAVQLDVVPHDRVAARGAA